MPGSILPPQPPDPLSDGPQRRRRGAQQRRSTVARRAGCPAALAGPRGRAGVRQAPAGPLPGQRPGDLKGEQRVPPEIRCSRSRTGRGRSPRCERAAGGSSPPRAAGRWPPGAGSAPARCDPGRAGRRRNRRAAPPGSVARPPDDEPTNASTLAEGASSHWTSSIATITGAEAARARRTPSDATDTARWSGGAPSASARRSAASSARRCGAGRSGSSKSNRSPSAA
jgi:hypothetical protein